MLTLLKLIPIRDWLYAGAFIALAAGVLAYTHHERALGEARIEAEIAANQKAAQAQIDGLSAKQNAALEVQYQAAGNYAPIVAPLLPTDCGSVPADLLQRINATHH